MQWLILSRYNICTDLKLSASLMLTVKRRSLNEYVMSLIILKNTWHTRYTKIYIQWPIRYWISLKYFEIIKWSTYNISIDRFYSLHVQYDPSRKVECGKYYFLDLKSSFRFFLICYRLFQVKSSRSLFYFLYYNVAFESKHNYSNTGCKLLYKKIYTDLTQLRPCPVNVKLIPVAKNARWYIYITILHQNALKFEYDPVNNVWVSCSRSHLSVINPIFKL